MDSQAISFCKKIEKHFGTSYYVATRFLPKRKRYATYTLYAFFRLPDEIVDTEKLLPKDAEKELDDFIAYWNTAKTGKVDCLDPDWSMVINSAAFVHKEFSIPFEPSDLFLQAMRMDLYKTRYESYSELSHYMAGSASAVGVMMSYVIGFAGGEKTLGYAKKLGEAMQLTNFLRDVGEDFRERGRIYLPNEDRERYQVSEKQIQEGRVDENFKKLMQYEINCARDLYQEAEKGIASLHWSGRYPVRLASRLYSAILREIENNQYDVFSKRARVNGFRKTLIALRALVG